jgi:hypothetical protein
VPSWCPRSHVLSRHRSADTMERLTSLIRELTHTQSSRFGKFFRRSLTRAGAIGQRRCGTRTSSVNRWAVWLRASVRWPCLLYGSLARRGPEARCGLGSPGAGGAAAAAPSPRPAAGAGCCQHQSHSAVAVTVAVARPGEDATDSARGPGPGALAGAAGRTVVGRDRLTSGCQCQCQCQCASDLSVSLRAGRGST